MAIILNGTSGITATGALTGLTTPITVAQGGTGQTTLTSLPLVSPVISGTPSGVGILTSATVQNALTTAVLFSAIPSWVKRITVMLNGVNTTSNGVPTIRLGTASGVENTVYTSTINVITTIGASGSTAATSGFEIVTSGNAAYLYSGNVVLTNISGNSWILSGNLAHPLLAFNWVFAGNKTLAGELTQVQLTTTGGTDTFAAGSINILYE